MCLQTPRPENIPSVSIAGLVTTKERAFCFVY
jgi:hypothetical protein